MNRVGSIGKIAGFTEDKMIALGASLMEQGMQAEVAATRTRKILFIHHCCRIYGNFFPH